MSASAFPADENSGNQPEPESPDTVEASADDCESDDWLEEEPQQKKKVGTLGPFFQVPNRFFGSGLARKIGTSASLLYFSLCEIANRDKHHRNTFKFSDKNLSKENGLGSRTIRNARAKLIENGLVKCSQEPGQSYTYTLLRQDLPWVPRSDRPRAKLKPRGNAALRTKQDP